MRKLWNSLPFRLLLGVVVGIIVGLVANESFMNLVVTAQIRTGAGDYLLRAADYYRLSLPHPLPNWGAMPPECWELPW